MRQSVGHAIRAAVSIGTGGLDFATGRALIHVAHEGPFDVLAIDSLMSVEPAELGAESLFTDVGGRQYQIDSSRVRRQAAIAQVPRNQIGKPGVGKAGALGTGVKDLAL